MARSRPSPECVRITYQPSVGSGLKRAAAHVRLGSKCEELSVSKSGPLYPLGGPQRDMPPLRRWANNQTWPFYSITSLAPASSEAGTSRPSASAALRFRLLDRQIGGLGALEDFSRVMANQAKGRSEAGSIADQPAGSGKFTPRIDRRNGTARCQRDELLAPAAQERIRADDERASMQLNKGGKGGVCPAQIRLRPPAESK